MVRGYTEGLLIGDNGYSVSAEFGFPLRFRKGNNVSDLFEDRLRGFVFVDHGGIFHFRGEGKSLGNNDSLASIGFGLNVDFTENYSGSSFWVHR